MTISSHYFQEFDDVIMSSGRSLPSLPPHLTEIHPTTPHPPPDINPLSPTEHSTSAYEGDGHVVVDEGERQGLPVKLAFITFNLESSVKQCLESCPSGPW